MDSQKLRSIPILFLFMLLSWETNSFTVNRSAGRSSNEVDDSFGYDSYTLGYKQSHVKTLPTKNVKYKYKPHVGKNDLDNNIQTVKRSSQRNNSVENRKSVLGDSREFSENHLKNKLNVVSLIKGSKLNPLNNIKFRKNSSSEARQPGKHATKRSGRKSNIETSKESKSVDKNNAKTVNDHKINSLVKATHDNKRQNIIKVQINQRNETKESVNDHNALKTTIIIPSSYEYVTHGDRVNNRALFKENAMKTPGASLPHLLNAPKNYSGKNKRENNDSNGESHQNDSEEPPSSEYDVNDSVYEKYIDKIAEDYGYNSKEGNSEENNESVIPRNNQPDYFDDYSGDAFVERELLRLRRKNDPYQKKYGRNDDRDDRENDNDDDDRDHKDDDDDDEDDDDDDDDDERHVKKPCATQILRHASDDCIKVSTQQRSQRGGGIHGNVQKFLHKPNATV